MKTIKSELTNYKIIPVIFPKEIFKINKFKDQKCPYSLIDFTRIKKEIEDNKKINKTFYRSYYS